MRQIHPYGVSRYKRHAARHTRPSDLTCALQGSSSVPVALQPVGGLKGTFNASFTITEAGAWTLQVALASDGKDVMGSPFTLQIASGTQMYPRPHLLTRPSLTAVEPLLSSCSVADNNGGLTGGAAGSQVSLTLTAKDQYGNLMTNQVYFAVAITLSTNASVIVNALTEFQSPGIYVFLYTVEQVGTYTMCVSCPVRTRPHVLK